MSVNLKPYQEFTALLELFGADISNTPLVTSGLSQRLDELKQYFITNIASLTDLNSRQQSYHTEISKQLRLLELDMMFLQGAKKSGTAQVRIDTIKDRIHTLIRYCQAIIT